MKKEFRNTERCTGVTVREVSASLQELGSLKVAPGRQNHNRAKGWIQYNYGFGLHNSRTLAGMLGRSHHMPDFPSWHPYRNRRMAYGSATRSDWSQ